MVAADRLRADPGRAPDADASRPDGDPRQVDVTDATVPQDRESAAALASMVEAVVALAGANAAAIQIAGPDGGRCESVAAVGFAPAAGALAAWCPGCAESRDAASACVRSGLAGRDERLPADVAGPVCRHAVAVPLRHQDRPVGTLVLLYAGDCTLPEALVPPLRAAGDLIGATLALARRSRENLRLRILGERQMLANEVHDSLAQGLTYLRMRMNLLREAIRQKDELRAHKLCADVDETLGNSQRRLREIITYFRSRMDAPGLVHALAETSERFLDRTGIALEFVNRVPDLRLPPEREIEVFHVVQEALANIARHAQATRARLVLEPHRGDYRVVVEDDGVGLAIPAGAPDDSGHYGIAIMRERARRLGGSVGLAALPGGGTRLVLTFPATPPPEEASQ